MAASDDQVQKKIQVSKLTYLAMLGLAALVLIKIKHYVLPLDGVERRT